MYDLDNNYDINKFLREHAHAFTKRRFAVVPASQMKYIYMVLIHERIGSDHTAATREFAKGVLACTSKSSSISC